MVVDKFSKYAHFIAIPHPYTACSIARVFLDNVYKLHGFAATIVSDRETLSFSVSSGRSYLLDKASNCVTR